MKVLNQNDALKFNELYSAEFDWKLQCSSSINNHAFAEFESKILYSLIRGVKPKNIIEFSPDRGFTTEILIQASIKNNQETYIKSYDLHDKSAHLDIEGLVTRTFTKGDVKSTLDLESVKKCDFMFIDSDHSYDFAKWYCKNILPNLNSGVPIWIHDWSSYNVPVGDSNKYFPTIQSLQELLWKVSNTRYIDEEVVFNKETGLLESLEIVVPTPMTWNEVQKRLNLHNNEHVVVKRIFIDGGLGNPVINLADYLYSIGEQNDVGEPAKSPSQILVRK